MFKAIVTLLVSVLIYAEISFGLNRTDVVPVLVWGPKLKPPSALQRLTAEELHAILDPPARSHLVVVFLEKQLSMRDFSLYKTHAKAYPAPYMASRENKTFFNSVIDPAKLFTGQKSFIATRTKTKQKPEKRFYPRNCSIGSKYIFRFNEVIEGPNKTAIIQSHDAIIADVSQSLENCTVMYIYTAHSALANSCNAERILRYRRSPQDDELPPESDEGTVLATVNYGNSSFFEIYDGNIKIIWKEFIHIYGSRTIVLNFERYVLESFRPETNIMLYSGEDSIEIFTKIKSDGSYVMTCIRYDGKNYWVHDVGAPLHVSFKCNNLHAAANLQNSIIWTGVQFQLFDKPLNGTTKKPFSPAWNCIGFMTIPILSGMFVLSLIIGIVAIGVTCIMDINNMDRFDNAKGKNISIPSL